MPNLQQTVLFKGSVEKEAYGDHVIEVRLCLDVCMSCFNRNQPHVQVFSDETMLPSG